MSLILALIFAAAALAGSAAAQEPAPAPAAWERRMSQLELQVKSLQEQSKAFQLIPPGQPAARTLPPAGEASASRSGFALQSADKDFVLRFQGLIQADGRFYTGAGARTASYTAAVNASAQAPASSQFLLRRVRPILSGTLLRIFNFFIQPDFGGSTSALYDAYLDIKPWTFANLRVGKFKTPLGLERLQTDSCLPFAERALPSNLMPQRDAGAQLFGALWHDAATYQVSVTNGVSDSAYTPDSDANNAKEVTARVFAQPFKNMGAGPLAGLGLGMAGSHTPGGPALAGFKTSAGQQQFFSYKSGVGSAGERSHLTPQANFYWGPLGVYGEWTQSRQVVRLGAASARLSHSAWQFAASWLLTGEKAAYSGVDPNKSFDPKAKTWGAWELAARVHQLQIDPRTFERGYADASVSASRATSCTAGVNWYLNKFVKFTADYETSWFKDGNGAGPRPTERVFDTRWQVAF